jgi:sentrin-specific protease 1
MHFFQTLFVNQLCRADGHNYDGFHYDAVQRWTTYKKLKFDILECDMLLIPVHQGVHWVLVVVDLKAKSVSYLDSLLGEDLELVGYIKDWVAMEYDVKRGGHDDDWKIEFPKDVPRQENGCDCGVFMLKYADYIAMGCPLSFNQTHMEYFRLRIIADAMAIGLRAD